MKLCKDCGGNLTYLFELNSIALFGCVLCHRVYFIELAKIDINKHKSVNIKSLVENAIQEYVKHRE